MSQKKSFKKKLVLKPMGTTLIRDDAPIQNETNEQINIVSKSIVGKKESREFIRPQPIIKKNTKINVRGMIVGAYSRKR
jgi:hypothetical protein